MNKRGKGSGLAVGEAAIAHGAHSCVQFVQGRRCKIRQITKSVCDVLHHLALNFPSIRILFLIALYGVPFSCQWLCMACCFMQSSKASLSLLSISRLLFEMRKL